MTRWTIAVVVLTALAAAYLIWTSLRDRRHMPALDSTAELERARARGQVRKAAAMPWEEPRPVRVWDFSGMVYSPDRSAPDLAVTRVYLN